MGEPAAGASSTDISVLVLDDETGRAIEGASVTVGDSLIDDSPTAFRGTTGTQGSLLLQGALARGPRALTATHDGYATISLVGLQSSQVTVYLKALPSSAKWRPVRPSSPRAK